MLRLRTLTLALLFAPMLAIASEPYVEIERRLTAEQVRATGLDTLKPEQLALLNRLLREESEGAAKVEAKARAAAASTQPDRQPDRDRGLLGLDDAPIRSRVVGTVSGWAAGTEFRLDNGQVWKVLKGEMRLPRALESPEIVVVPGIAGRWFLQVDEDLPKARVYRID